MDHRRVYEGLAGVELVDAMHATSSLGGLHLTLAAWGYACIVVIDRVADLGLVGAG